MFRVYLKELFKKIFKIIVITFVIISIIWAVVFTIDYLVYKNRNQTIFTITKIENDKDGYTTTQNGLGYKYVLENDNTKLYIFGKEVK